MSSNLNALSGVIYKDVVCPFLKNTPSEKTGSDILKLTVLIVGFLCTCLVFLVERMGQIFSISLTVWGITEGPIFGAFTLGVLFPKANRKVCRRQCIHVLKSYFQGRPLWNDWRFYFNRVSVDSRQVFSDARVINIRHETLIYQWVHFLQPNFTIK